MLDRRGQLLRAAVGFAGCRMLAYDLALHALRTWLGSWSGIGHVAVGMHRQAYDLQLTQYDDLGWRATFYPKFAQSVVAAGAFDFGDQRDEPGCRGRRSSMTGAAVTLGLSSLALAAFPLVRPFFPFDPTKPTETLAGASRAVTSPRWLVAHYLALIGFVLLLCVLPALHTRLAPAGARPNARLGVLLSGVGVALILPTLGVELYALPAIARLFLDNPAVASLVGSIYLGGATLVMVLGLLLLAVGAIMLATAIARSRSLPTWAGITFAVGLALWCPLLPPAARVADGLLIGIGGIGLAWALRRAA